MLPDPYSYQNRDDTMKPGSNLRDSIKQVSQWFREWNDVEQTIACYLLLQELKPAQARFLSLVLDHKFRENAYEVQDIEKNANDPESLIGLQHENVETAIKQLLQYLLLLHPGNEQASQEYLNLIQTILPRSIEHSLYEEDCKQLVSLIAVHPAFVQRGQGQAILKWWRSLRDEKTEYYKERQRMPPGLSTTSYDLPYYNGGRSSEASGLINIDGNGVMKSQVNGWRQPPQLQHKDSGIGESFDKGSCSPGSASSPVTFALDEGAFDIPALTNRPRRSGSFPVDPSQAHRKVSPETSFDSDDDSVTIRMPTSDNVSPGMKDVPMWLKSLRLHKYNYIFTELTYEEMLSITEDYLISKNVTLGARNKILLYRDKLKERGKTLLELGKDVLVKGKLPAVLAELKNILISPIPPYVSLEGIKSDTTGSGDGSITEDSLTALPSRQNEMDINDLPSLIVKVMGKASTQILVNVLDEESCITYLGLLDRVLSHEAFTNQQKKKMHIWKMQCQVRARELASRRKIAGIDKGVKNWYDPHGNSSVPGSGRRRLIGRHASSLKGTSSTGMSHSARAGPVANLHKKLTPSSSFNMVKQHQPVCRTKSAPIKPSPQGLFQPRHLAQDAEGINKSLESLCLTMARHALEDSSERPDDQF